MRLVFIYITTAIAICLLTVVSTYAYDFSIKDKSGLILYMSIVDSLNNEVSISAYDFDNDQSRTLKVEYGTILNIPSEVEYNGETYKVTEVPGSGFVGIEGLSGLVFPSTMNSIDENAFAYCEELSSIVFPVHQIKLDDDAFVGCTSIADVTFGSEWHTIDFLCFRNSDTFSVVFVPASVTELKNLHSVWSIVRFEVDDNNPVYESYDGMLFSKGLTKLIACPGNRDDDVIIPEGTTAIMNYAFNGCWSVEVIYLPSSVHIIPFDVFSRDLFNLEKVILRSDKLIYTASFGRFGEPVFALEIPKTVKVMVPEKLYEPYLRIYIGKSGCYSSSEGDNVYDFDCSRRSMMKKRQIQSF